MDAASLFDRAPDPQLVLDDRGVVVRANRLAGQLGLRDGRLIGCPAVLLVRPELRRAWREAVERAEHDREATAVQGPLAAHAWTGHTFELLIAPLDDARTPLLVRLRDVTTAVGHERRSRRLERLHRDHREVLGALEAAVRPRALPPLPLDLGVAGRVADILAPFGGDLHDWQLLEDGTLHLCVVDATGHGVLALRSALAIRDAARVLALDGCGVDDLPRHLDTVCRAQEPGLVGTAVLARYDPADGTIAVSCAGHPPGLRWRHGAPMATLGSTGPPIGVVADRPPPQRAQLAVDELLVLHTDGVTDARARPGDPDEASPLGRDLDRLASVADATAADVADGLLPPAGGDDALVLVLWRRRDPPDRREDVVETRRFRSRVRGPRTSDVTDLRHAVSDWLTARATPPTQLRSALLVLSELASNAVQAEVTHLEVELDALADGSLELLVHDDGAGFDVEMALSRLESGGYGLRVVEGLTEDLRVATGPQGTVTRALVPADR